MRYFPNRQKWAKLLSPSWKINHCHYGTLSGIPSLGPLYTSASFLAGPLPCFTSGTSVLWMTKYGHVLPDAWNAFRSQFGCVGGLTQGPAEPSAIPSRVPSLCLSLNIWQSNRDEDSKRKFGGIIRKQVWKKMIWCMRHLIVLILVSCCCCFFLGVKTKQIRMIFFL